MQDIMSVLKEMDPAELADAVNKAKTFVNSPEGKMMMEKLKNGQTIDGLPVTAQQQDKLVAQLTKDPKTAKQLAAMLGKK